MRALLTLLAILLLGAPAWAQKGAGTPPGGTATAANQTTANATLGSILSALGGLLSVQQPDVRGSGTIAAQSSNAAYTINLANGAGTASFVVTGLAARGATLTIEASDDAGTTWNAVNGVQAGTGILFQTLTTDTQFRVNASGRTNLRLRVSSTGTTGNITVASSVSTAAGLTTLSSPLPPGTNAIGTVTSNDGGTGGTGITQPSGGSGLSGWLSGIYKYVSSTVAVTQSGTWNVVASAGTNNIGYTSGISVVPLALDVATVSTGGTAVTAVSAGHCAGGCWVRNPETATEKLCISVATSAGSLVAATTSDSSSTTCIGAGVTYVVPATAPIATGVSVNAASNSHAFSGAGFTR